MKILWLPCRRHAFPQTLAHKFASTNFTKQSYLYMVF